MKALNRIVPIVKVATLATVCVLASLYMFHFVFNLRVVNKGACPEGRMCINKDTVGCLVLGMEGWKPVSPVSRQYISKLVKDGKAEYKFNMQSIECFDRFPDKTSTVGDSVGTLPLDWWRPKR